MIRERRYWTEKEVAYLKRTYSNLKYSVARIARHLNMSSAEVYNQARNHGLSRNKGVPVNKGLWSAAQIKFIRQNFHSMTNVALARKLGKTLTVVRNKCRELGLLHMVMEYWTQEQVEFLKANYRTIGDVELAKIFQERWPKQKLWTSKHIDKKRGYLGLKRTVAEWASMRTHRFEPDQYKDFDGKTFPQGKERIWSSNGVSRRMIKVGKDFVHKARHVWELSRGPIPKGMKVHFKDGNTLNCSLSNLELLTKSELARKISVRNHKVLSDNYIAGLLASGWHTPVDKNLKKLLLQNPELLEAKRLQLLNNRQIKKQ